MKNTLKIAFATFLVASQGYAFDVAGTNVLSADATAVPIVDNAGNPIAQGGGYIAIGTFSDVPTNETSMLIPTTFTAFGTPNGANGNSFANGIGADGFYDFSSSASIPEGSTDAPVGEQAYVVIGNALTLADSEFFAVLTLGEVFGTENLAGSGGLTININDSNVDSALVVGNRLDDFEIANVATFNRAVQLVGVPEPSSALLSLVGLAFIARRRR